MNQKLAKLCEQLLSVWKQLGLNQRLSVVLAAIAVLGGMGMLGYWSSRPDYALLYGKLGDGEAAKVVAVLDAAKVPYQVGRNGTSIYVPSDKVHTMRMQLAAKGVPQGDGVGFEIFDKPNFGISDFVQRANYLRAVQGELGRTISQLDEVAAARVMIVLPENRLLVDNQKFPTASVFVQVRGNAQLSPQAVSSIRFLVANAVEGLKANHVTVVDNRGNVLSENSDDSSATGMTTAQLNIQRNYEQYLAKKAESMLETVLGPGQAVVRVAAELNFDTMTRTEEKYDPDNQVMRTSTTTDETTDNSTATAGGVPGVTVNASTETNNPTASPVTNMRTQKKQITSQYEINKTVSNLTQAAGNVKRLTASVFIAAKVEGTGPDRQVVQRAPEELDKLRRIVQTALGVTAGSDRNAKDVITLEEMPFNDQQQIEMTNQLQSEQERQFYWEIGKNAGYGLLALAALTAFWRALRRTPVETIPIGVPVGKLSGNGNGQTPREQEENVVTVDVLNQLVRDNPQNMTQAIRNWLHRS